MKVPTSIFIFLFPIILSSQEYKGKILSPENNEHVEYVNIGVVGKNMGTVSDELGNYKLILKEDVSLKDSVRISKIGYTSQIFSVKTFKDLNDHTIFLQPKAYSIAELKVAAKRRIRLKKFGTPIPSSSLVTMFGDGFNHFWLGQELGTKIDVKRKAKIRTIHINFGKCSFDSVEMRINIYKAQNNSQKLTNILQKPIYFSFEKKDIESEIVVDVTDLSIIVKDTVLISVEYYKHAGEGKLGIFQESLPIGKSYFRKSSEAPWKTAPGQPGIYFYGELLK